MSSAAAFDSEIADPQLFDPLLAYTYSNGWDENMANDDTQMHYLAIPVDALNTRSVTIQVFYDNAAANQQVEKGKSGEESQKLVKKEHQVLFDPFINQNDNEAFENLNENNNFNSDNDPMLLDSQLNGNYLMGEGNGEDCDFMNKDIIDEKHDSIFFDDGLDGAEDYGSNAAETYQNSFTVAANLSDGNAQQATNEEFRVIKRFSTIPVDNSSNYVQQQQESQFNNQIQVVKPTPPPIKMYRCTFDHCGKMFPSQRALKYHSVGHSPAIYSCSKCRKSFGSMLKLKRHSMIHDGIRPFPCDSCEKSFTTKSNLNVHRRTHTGEKPYVCSVCSRAFSHQSHAKAHLKIHLKKLNSNITATINEKLQ